MKEPRTLKKLFLSLAFAILFGLALLEVTLRLAGFFYLKFHTAEPAGSKDKALNIVCVGDSFTMGVGAQQRQSYPSQLEEILNSNNKILKYRVINAGMGGATTSTVLRSLDKIILEYKPSLLIVIIGSNDRWNYAGLNLSAIRHRQIPLTIKLNSLLFNLKTYKLLQIVSINLKSKIDGIIRRNYAASAQTGNVPARREDGYLRLAAESYKQKHELEEAVIYLKKALEINPLNGKTYELLAHIYREQERDKGEILAFTKKALEMSRDDPQAQESLYKQLLCLYNGIEIYDPDTERILEKNKDYYDYNKLVNRFYGGIQGEKMLRGTDSKKRVSQDFKKDIFRIRHSLIDRVTLFNLESIVRKCKDNKIKLVFCSYPESKIKHMGHLLKEHGVTFIDFTPVFKDRLQSGKKEDYFVLDGHCNARGYRVMAEIIADRITSGQI